jgi:hypothetical protein
MAPACALADEGPAAPAGRPQHVTHLAAQQLQRPVLQHLQHAQRSRLLAGLLNAHNDLVQPAHSTHDALLLALRGFAVVAVRALSGTCQG